MSAAAHWSESLVEWAIPTPILASAPESPWSFPVEVFARNADAALLEPTPSSMKAIEALPAGGSVLDVGCGAGAAALPLTTQAATLIGVDSSAAMLAAFRVRGESLGAAVSTIEGRWPDVAAQTPIADVVVCHHVAYNVPDLAAFARALSDHARQRVVMELTAEHPMRVLNDLWLHFHGLVRPKDPTVADALAVLQALGLRPERHDWAAPALSWTGPTARADLIAWVRRRLCLPAERDPEIAAALGPRVLVADGTVSLPPRPVVTIWWAGTAVSSTS